MANWFSVGERLPADLQGETHEIVIGESFVDLLQAEKWERKYTYFGFGEDVAKIYAGDSSDSYLCIYSKGVVKVYYRSGWVWPTTSVVYYKIPKEVVQDIIDWIKINHPADEA